jgi:hypothetical protein
VQVRWAGFIKPNIKFHFAVLIDESVLSKVMLRRKRLKCVVMLGLMKPAQPTTKTRLLAGIFEQKRLETPADKSASIRINESSLHCVRVTFAKYFGRSGSNPRARDSASTIG